MSQRGERVRAAVGRRHGEARAAAMVALEAVGAAAIGLLIVELFVLDPGGRVGLGPATDLVLALAALLEFARAAVALDRRAYLATNRVGPTVAVVILLRAGWAARAGAPAWLDASGIRLALLVPVAVLGAWRLGGAVRRVLHARLGQTETITTRPLNAMLISFPAAALVGALLLILPGSRAAGAAPITFVDAFFTATSAVCVTGLTVRDTGADFSAVGQGVILALIQLGGLGIMTFATLFSLLLGRAGHLSERALAADRHDRPLGAAFRLIAFVVGISVVIELAGAALLLDQFPTQAGLPLAERFQYALFHSVSAFCNAGFGLEADSLAGLSRRPWPLLVFSGLIVVGGLGFTVLLELLVTGWRRLTRLVARDGPVPRLGLHSRLVLRFSVVLLVGGAAGLVLTSDMPPLEAVFLAVSARTAGFSAGDVGRLPGGALLLTMALMFVGASPGSTGGGIKTTTLGVVIAGVKSMWQQREPVDVLRRTVPATTVRSAFVIVVLSASLVGAVAFVLMVQQPDLPFRELLFEACSAFATVGLSTGVTAALDPVGRLVLCVAMFLGRLGPLSVMVLLVRGRTPLAYRYAEEAVEVG